jgi:hypothetical protein
MGKSRGSEVFTASSKGRYSVNYQRSGRPDIGVYTSRFEPLPYVLSPAGLQEPVRRLQRCLRQL